jgi:hypothetical protein
MAQVVFVYELHGATDQVEKKLHKDLGAAKRFNYTGVHSTWEYTVADPGIVTNTLFNDIETNFGVVAAAAGASAWDLKMWGGPNLQYRSSPRPKT